MKVAFDRNTRELEINSDSPYRFKVHEFDETEPLWENDEVQFTRFIAEMAAVIDFTDEQIEMLCESMDVEPKDIDEIFDRAVDRFDLYKSAL